MSWYPSNLLNGKHAINPYAIIILNQPINTNALNAVAQGAALLVCADAGGNRLLQHEQSSKDKTRLPDAIVGDLDSLSPEARSHYEGQGVKIVEKSSQYATDFQKCLEWTRDYWDRTKPADSELDIVALGGLGGRVDQGFSQIHHLYMASQQKKLLRGRIYLLSEQSLTFILDEGMNEIHVESDTFEQNVGIIPVLGLIRITTKGFEWDVDSWETEFGGQLSTSNHWKSNVLTIDVDGKRPLFTLELAKRFSLAGG